MTDTPHLLDLDAAIAAADPSTPNNVELAERFFATGLAAEDPAEARRRVRAAEAASTAVRELERLPGPDEPARALAPAVESTTPDALAGLRSPYDPPAPEALAAPIVRFASVVLGIEPWPRQVEMLAAMAAPGARTIVMRCGRRSGKSTLAAIAAVYEATAGAEEHRRHARPGERITVALVANSREQARVLGRMVAGFFENAELAPMVASVTANAVELRNGMEIAVMPCNARAIRGRAIAVAVIDELAHAIDSAGRSLSPQDAQELLDAIAPATAQFASGRIVVCSTPRWPSGVFFELCQLAASPLHPKVVELAFATPSVNPTIPAEFYRAEALADPAGFRREYLAQFGAGIEAVFDDAALRAATGSWRELRPAPGVRYTISADPAYSGDAFAVCVGHVEPDGRLIVDMSRTWHGGRGRALDHSAVLDEIAVISRAYSYAPIVTDQFAMHAVTAGLRDRGITASGVAWTAENKLEAVQATRQRLYGGTIALPADPDLIAELAALELRPSPTGKPRIAAGHGHDDRAMALLGLVVALDRDTASGVSIGPDIYDE